MAGCIVGGTVVLGDERLNAELKLLFDVTGGGAGLGTVVAGAGAGGDVAKPPKSSEAKRSVGMDDEAVLGAADGGGTADMAGFAFWVNEKSKPLDLVLVTGGGLVTGGLGEIVSKKLPPLSGTDGAIFGGAGDAFAGMLEVKLVSPLNAEGD